MPIKKFRAGAISATIFKNEFTKDGNISVFYSVVVDRRYKDKQDQWQSTNSFRQTDLPKIRYCVDKAYEYLIELRNENPVQPDQPVKEEMVM